MDDFMDSFHGQFLPTVAFTPALVTIVWRGKERTLFGIENFHTQRKNFRYVDSFVNNFVDDFMDSFRGQFCPTVAFTPALVTRPEWFSLDRFDHNRA